MEYSSQRVPADLASRRTSFGIPLTTYIYPQSAAERHESVLITKKMEESYGFHYITNDFVLRPDVEAEYQAYYMEMNINAACNASMIVWVLWVALSIADIANLFSEDSEVRRISSIDCLLTFPVILPIPALVMMCRDKRYRHHMQILLTIIVNCFAFSLMAGGVHSVSSEYRKFIGDDVEWLMTYTGSMSSSQIVKLDGQNDTARWMYKNVSGTSKELFAHYLENVILPAAQLNINLVRPVAILVVAPIFKLDAFHYICAAISVNWGYAFLVSSMFPQTSAKYFLINKFLLIFSLTGITLILVSRARHADRFMRLNFLHVRAVEEKARITLQQKEIIQKENNSLKRMLEAHSNNQELDLDSPMAKIISDLKTIQMSSSLATELQGTVSQILALLTQQGENLFAPDLHGQLQKKRDGDMDGDTKSWASTVLANKSYTRNRRSTIVGTKEVQESIMKKINDLPNEPRGKLHPEVEPIEQSKIVEIGGLMKKDGWNLDVHYVAELTNGYPVSYITMVVFEQHNLCNLCAVDKNLLTNFLWFVDQGYIRNPYHNNCHAADVVNFVQYIIADIDDGFLQTILNAQEFFAAILAAAIHDFRHPGKSNNFMVKSESPLAVKYSDSSVLERMHLAEAFFLSKEPLCDIFHGMKSKQYTEVRKAIIEMVLCTDLSVHLQLVGSLKTALLSQNKDGVMDSPMVLMKAVIKCADIGHSSKKMSLHARWSELIIEEFFLQGDEEKRMGMDVSPFMNRENENSAKNQVGFFEFIILPFFDVVSQIVFTPGFKPIMDQININYSLWKKAEAMELKSIKDILDQVFVTPKDRLNSMPE